MKSAFILICIFILSNHSYSQVHEEKLRDTIVENCNCITGKVTKANILYPILTDTLKLEKDLLTSVNIGKLIEQFNQESVGAVYMYLFSINNKGKAKAKRYDNAQWAIEINRFVKETFNNYQWRLLTPKDCTECNTSRQLILFLYFDIEKKTFSISIKGNGPGTPVLFNRSFPYGSIYKSIKTSIY